MPNMAIPSMIRLDVASRSATVSSAVASVRTSGVNPTGMLRFSHAPMST